jgi:hypothetical protein
MLAHPTAATRPAAGLLLARALRWLSDNRPLPSRLTARDWLALAVFALYKVTLAASLVYVWVHVWWVLVDWRPAVHCWRKMTEPVLVTAAARLLVARRRTGARRAA